MIETLQASNWDYTTSALSLSKFLDSHLIHFQFNQDNKAHQHRRNTLYYVNSSPNSAG